MSLVMIRRYSLHINMNRTKLLNIQQWLLNTEFNQTAYSLNTDRYCETTFGLQKNTHSDTNVVNQDKISKKILGMCIPAEWLVDSWEEGTRFSQLSMRFLR
jgi:hypothetical protein